MTDPVTGTIRLTQPTVGGDAGSWGTILNSNLSYTDTAINGITAITLSSSTYTLPAAGDVNDQARSAWYSFSGSPGANCTVTLPANKKIGIASNAVTGGYSVILTTGSGNTITIDNGSTVMFYCDGTNVALVPWGSPGTVPAISVSGATTLTSAQKGSYVQITANSSYILGLPTPVGHAGNTYLLNFLSGTGTATLSTPAGSITGGYGLNTSTALYVKGPVFQIVSDGTNWVTQGNAAVAATTISATGAVTFGSTLNVTGSTSFAGNVTVAGTLNAGVLSGTSTTSSLSVGGTSNFVGSATFSSNVNALGTLTAAVIDVTGTSSLVGNVTAGANVIVTGTVTSAGEKNTGTATMAVLDVTGTSSQVGNATFGSDIIATGTVTSAGAKNTGTSTMAVLDVTGTSSQVGAGTFGAALTVVGTVTASADIQATGTVTSGGAKNTGTSTMAVLDVTGTSSQVGNATFGANVITTGTTTMAVLDVTGTSSQVGNATFGGNVTVTSTVTDAGEKNTGTSTMAVLDVTGTSSQVGLAIFGANQQITGTSTMAVLDVTGTSSQVGNATFGAAINVTGTGTFSNPVDGLAGFDSIGTGSPGSGVLGYNVTASGSAGIANQTLTNLASLVVAPGIWFVSGSVNISFTGNLSAYYNGLGTASGTIGHDQVTLIGIAGSNANLQMPFSTWIYRATATTTFYGMAQCGYSSGTATGNCSMAAVCIG